LQRTFLCRAGLCRAGETAQEVGACRVETEIAIEIAKAFDDCKGERSLVRDGEVDLVLTSRKAFQRTMSSQMIAAVEQHSGRQVLAFLGDNHVDPDIAVETFVLVPRDDHESDGQRSDTT